MEATGKHNFIGQNDDELSFHKNTPIKILNMEDDTNWYKAEIDGKVGVVPANYITMKPQPWYHGSISRSEAQDRLLQVNSSGQYLQTDGAFLVRASETSPGDFSLSVKIGDGIEHFKVLRDASKKFFLWVAKFDTLNGLIDHHRGASVCRSQNVYLKDMVKEEVKVIYDYKAKTDEELSIKPGDVITVVDKSDPNWWKGEIVQGGVRKTGFFPVTYTSGDPH